MERILITLWFWWINPISPKKGREGYKTLLLNSFLLVNPHPTPGRFFLSPRPQKRGKSHRPPRNLPRFVNDFFGENRNLLSQKKHRCFFRAIQLTTSFGPKVFWIYPLNGGNVSDVPPAEKSRRSSSRPSPHVTGGPPGSKVYSHRPLT